MRGNEKAKAAAAELIPAILAERDAKLAEFRAELETDRQLYEFCCNRHGDFLVVCVGRGKDHPAVDNIYFSQRQPNMMAHVINLGITSLFALKPGREPDMKGCVRFRRYSGETVSFYYETENTYRPTIVLDVKPDQHGHMYHGDMEDVFGNMHVQDSPRSALDDVIYFNGAGVSIFAPFGLGQSVLDKILSATRKGAPRPKL